MKFHKMINCIKKHILSVTWISSLIVPLYLRAKAFARRINLFFGDNYIQFSKENKAIRISKNHILYGLDIINSFDYYFNAVEPINIENILLVDYSLPKFHNVIGYNKHPIFFPSLAEPLSTTNQYIKFSDLSNGNVALDLGAYSGLTSIIFKELVGSDGVVIAVDADSSNYEAAKLNFKSYFESTGTSINLLFGAVWNHNLGLSFSSEGNMGSSASDLVGDARGHVNLVPSFTLSAIAEKYSLKNVDFIKCDIEGAESVIFDDDAFFSKFHPRIILETHFIDGVDTAIACSLQLSKYGYVCSPIEQDGVTFPLLQCVPSQH